jgi:CHAT domain-containing protein
LPGNEKRGIEELTFGPLPGTRKESDVLPPRFKGWKWKVRDPMMGKDATKEAPLRIHSPYILHPTHGFLESKHDLAVPVTPPYIGFANRMKNSKFFENPMHRSSLALAGAQATLEAWMRGEAPPRANDGILTAEDVSALDLKGTWLVCLSACDTGSSEVQAGEGVIGLRRGYIEAGTENLLRTLWSVSDEATVQIMSDFYEHSLLLAFHRPFLFDSENLARVHNIVGVDRFLNCPHDTHRLAVLGDQEVDLAAADAVLASTGAVHRQRAMD